MRKRKQPKKGQDHTHKVPRRGLVPKIGTNSPCWEDMPPILTVAEVALILRLSDSLVYKMIDTRQIAVLRCGSTIRIERDALLAYLRGEKNPPGETRGNIATGKTEGRPPASPQCGIRPGDWRNHPGFS